MSMKKVKLLSLAAFAAAIFLTMPAGAEKVAASGAEIGVWTQDYDAAKKLAAEKSRPILLNFTGSDWCYWCKLMTKRVFTQEAWKNWAKDKIALVMINFPSDPKLVPKKFVKRNRELQNKFGVEGYPTFILLSSDGEKELGRLGASRDATPEKFISEIEGLLDSAE